jgi:hypothetical protein
MVLFWLFIFRDIILNMRKETGKLPSAGQSLSVVKQYLPVLKPDVWKSYYSESLMLDPKTAMYWRASDLRKICAPTVSRCFIPQLPKSDSRAPRVERFAFAVVSLYLGFSVPSKRWIIEQALAVLESCTMRLRCKNPTVQPYSETQTYFWISHIHGILASIPYFEPIPCRNVVSGLPCVLNITLEDLMAANLVSPVAWQQYYSPKVWHSMEARMKTIQPDIKPLNSHFHDLLGKLSNQLRKRNDWIHPELPSDEELLLHLAVAEKQLSPTDHGNLTSLVHAQHLFLIFEQLVKLSTLENFQDCLGHMALVMEVKGELLNSLPFWTMHIWKRLRLDSGRGIVRLAKEGDALNAFKKFLRIHLELVHERLWTGPHSITERLKRKHAVNQEQEISRSNSEIITEKSVDSTRTDKESAIKAAEAFISNALKVINQGPPPMSGMSTPSQDAASVLTEEDKEWEML